MSESAKMGLFGSKDKTQEEKTEAKDDSPDRYAPYCIDSDCETYDTETLSIMDIHDIIGVQSEPVSDSTLESEIAALTQIITDSKTDGGQNAVENKPGAEHKGKLDSKTVQTSNTKQYIKSTLNNDETVGPVKGESTVAKDMELENQQESNNVKDNSEHNVSVDSAVVVGSKDVEDADVLIKVDIERNRSKDKCTLQTIASEQNVNRTIESDSSICGSLQLIGQAYSSEDSQDMTLDDAELASKNTLMSDEEKKETSKSQGAVNNATEISSKILDKICTNKDTPAEGIKNDAMDVDAPNCTHAEKKSNISEKIEIHTEATVDSPKHVVSESKMEEVTVDAVEMGKMEEQVLEERKKTNTEAKEEITQKCTKMDVEESAQSEHDPSTSTVKEPEAEVLKENPKCDEPMDIDQEEEHETEECRADKKEASQEEKGDTNTSNIDIIEEVKSTQIEAGNVVDSTESSSTDTMHSKDNVEEKESETDVQAPEEKVEMDTEKLENKEKLTIEKLQTAEGTNTDKLEAMEEVETAKKMDTMQSEIAEEMDTMQSEIAEEVDTKQSEIVEELDTKQSEISEEVATKQSETKQEVDTKQPEEMDTKQPEEMDTKQPEEMDTKQPEEMDTKQPEEMDTKQPEEMDTKQPEE
ncbi:uncharacterized protein LOC143363028, partial [Halictus rubicundus]|uniref:uncharacterized protein LOC143363028 n=1 Tax=Halictus rubicundus TaxID=77578 RepID=UPI0040354581